MNPDSESRGPTLDELAELYLETMGEDADGVFSPRRAALDTARDGRTASVGDLWIATGGPEDLPMLVAVTWIEGDLARCVVVLDEPNLATSEDVLVSEQDSPLGVPLALCVWRDVPVSTESLHTYLGALPVTVVEPLAMLLQNRLTGGFRRTPIGPARLRSGEPSVRWSIEPADGNGPRYEHLAGAPVLRSEDPRLRVREELSARSVYLEAAAIRELVLDAEFRTADHPTLALLYANRWSQLPASDLNLVAAHVRECGRCQLIEGIEGLFPVKWVESAYLRFRNALDSMILQPAAVGLNFTAPARSALHELIETADWTVTVDQEAGDIRVMVNRRDDGEEHRQATVIIVGPDQQISFAVLLRRANGWWTGANQVSNPWANALQPVDLEVVVVEVE